MKGRGSVPASKFPLKIQVDLFDGKLTGLKPARVHATESFAGQAVDYDFGADVGLIRIRPGRRLPASPVVPAGWKPRPGRSGNDRSSPGCSQGADATAWSTQISRGDAQFQAGGRPYASIECTHAPKQGRSGGGLFTTDGYLAGVCDFADYNHDRGLYASPRSIYKLLDKHKLTVCYAPESKPKGSGGGALLASERTPSPRPAATAPKYRSQGPEEITAPHPSLLGARIPKDDLGEAPARKISRKAVEDDLAFDDDRPAPSARDRSPVEAKLPSTALPDPFDDFVTERVAPPAEPLGFEDFPPPGRSRPQADGRGDRAAIDPSPTGRFVRRTLAALGRRRGEVERPARSFGARRTVGHHEVDRRYIEAHALSDRPRLGTGADDSQSAGREAGERAVVVATLETGPDDIGVAHLDPAAGGFPVARGEGRADGLLERAEAELRGLADRDRAGEARPGRRRCRARRGARRRGRRGSNGG